jgi:hypothetical protein
MTTSIPFNKSRFLASPMPVTYSYTPGAGLKIYEGRRGAQWTASEGHPWHVKPRPEGDIGGDFTTVKLDVVKDSWNYTISTAYGLGGSLVHGPIYPFSNPSARFNIGELRPNDSAYPTGLRVNDYFPDLSSSDAFLKAQGTIAIDRVSPVNSIASVATTLGELKRDGLPAVPGHTLWKDRTLTAKHAGNEYLNYIFGWSPLVSDVRKFAKAASQSSKILSQLERDSGKQVRRRYEFPIERSSSVIETNVRDLPYPSMPYYAYPDGNEWGYRTTTRTIEKSRWFSGAFTYYLPSGGSAFDRVAKGYLEFEKLYGIGLDPETLWNLTPWSWATDWAFNTGSVIANLTDAAQYGLVMPFGYIMERTSVRYDYRMTGLTYNGPGKTTHTLSVEHTSKRRLRASPFGFGLSWDGFSNTQLAILAALGITRSGRK